MADKIIHGRIDVTKINKAWLYKGEKGTYLDFVMFYNEKQDTYGQNGMITQSVPQAIYKKEVADKVEKSKMTQGEILGNLKNWASQERKESTPGYTGEEDKTSSSSEESEENLPF